jgi:peptidoglycan/LPS O-acetylase OafA/YrhL
MQNHRNNIGLLRLVFASLVIIGHAPEMTDGNRLREPLTRLFHTLLLGEVAVDGFFLLSGYLISQSMFRSGSLREYVKRRVLRIYPAFVVSWLLCVYVLGPLTGGHPGSLGLRPLFYMALLQPPPSLPGQLAGLPHPVLNGAMWTIQYEFGCYLAIAVFGVLGLLRRRGLMVVVAAAAAGSLIGAHWWGVLQSYRFHEAMHLTVMFMMGTLFFLFRDALIARMDWKLALLSGLAAILLLGDPLLAPFGMITFGALGIFWLSFEAPLGWLQKVNNRWDISYGVYLYGWPIAAFILWRYRHISPWTLAAVSLPAAMIAGAASWWGLEKWTKDLFKSPSRQLR